MLRYQVTFRYCGKNYEGQLTIWDETDAYRMACTLLEIDDDTIGIGQAVITKDQLRELRWGEQVEIFSATSPEWVQVWDAKELPEPAPVPPIDDSQFPFC